MKKTLLALLLVGLLLVGCEHGTVQPTQAPTTAPTAAATEAPSESATVPPTDEAATDTPEATSTAVPEETPAGTPTATPPEDSFDETPVPTAPQATAATSVPVTVPPTPQATAATSVPVTAPPTPQATATAVPQPTDEHGETPEPSHKPISTPFELPIVWF